MHFIKEFRWVGFSREVSTGSECRQMKVWLTIPRKKNMGEKLPFQECSMHVPVILTMVGPGRSCQQRNWRKHGRGLWYKNPAYIRSAEKSWLHFERCSDPWSAEPQVTWSFEHFISPLAFTELYFDFVSLAPWFPNTVLAAPGKELHSTNSKVKSLWALRVGTQLL